MADPFAGLETLPARSGGAFAGLETLGTSPMAPHQTQSLVDAFLSGVQSSATGLAARGRLPDKQLDPDAPWYNRLAAAAGNVATDLPLSAVGAAIGAPVGAAMSGPAAPLGAVVGGGAGAFGVPMALRDALIAAYNNNNALSWSGVADIALAALKGGTKGAVIGGLTGGAGVVAGRAVGTAIAPGVGTALSVQGAERVIGGTALATELTTLTTASAALEGHMPTWQDFMDNAILLGGMKGATAIAKGLRDVYAETGRRPEQVVVDAQRDPTIAADLERGAPIRGYHGTKADIGVTELSKSNDLGPHFSVSRDTAEIFANDQGTPGKVLEADLHIKKALDMPDMAGWQPGAVADWLDANGFTKYKADGKGNLGELATKVLNATFGMADVDASLAKGAGIVREFLTSKGYDAIRYKNEFEGKPVDTYIVLDREGVIAGPSSLPRAYKPIALEERIKAAIGEDPRPELARAALADNPKVPERPSVKWEYVTDGETAQGVLREITARYQPEIEAQRRGVVTNQQSVVDAQALLDTGKTGPHVVGAAGNSAEVLMRAALLRDALSHAQGELAKIANVPEVDLTPAMKLQALAALERVAMLNAEFAGVRAEAGRALQILQAVKRGDPNLLGQVNVLVGAAERKGSLQDIAKLMASLKDNPEGMARFAKGYAEATTFEKVLEVWKAGILSGPQTHLANVFGNATKWALEVPESAIAATIYAVDAAARGEPIKFAQWKARALAPVYGVQFGAADALRVAGEVWRGQGESVEKGDLYKTAIGGKAGEIVRLPFKALSVEDAFFRTFGEKAEAHKMAVDRAVKEGFHPDSAEFSQAVVRYVQDPAAGLSEAAGKAAVEAIQKAGAEAVFSQRLGPFLETVQGAIARHAPAVSFVVPFIRTPANLVSWAVQHVPGLNLMSGRWREDYAAGGERQARAISRVVMGAGLTASAVALSQSGVLTGGGMFDKEQGNAKRAAGWQPYSVLIDGKYYSYQRIEPVAKVLGLAADLIELGQATKDEQDFGKTALLLTMMFGNATVSTTYLSGLSNVIQAVTDPARRGEPLMEQYATSLVPRIVGQTAQMMDPDKREVDGTIDAIQSQIPWLREKLLPKRDVWGEPSTNDRWFAVLPVATSDVSQDKVRTEAQRLQLAISDAPKFVTEKGPFKPGDKRVELSPEQRDIFKQVAGKNAMAILSPIVNAPDWERIPDFAKAEIYKKVIEGTRKQGQYAALPPDDEARVKVREKIVNEILRQTEAVSVKPTERRIK
jgi:hypothetical protein